MTFLFLIIVAQYTLYNVPPTTQKGGGFERPPSPWKQIGTIKVNVLFKLCLLKSKIVWKSLKISFEKQDFPKFGMKCLEIARFQDYAPNTPGLPRPPAAIAPRFVRCVTRSAGQQPPSGNSCLRAWHVYVHVVIHSLFTFYS